MFPQPSTSFKVRKYSLNTEIFSISVNLWSILLIYFQWLLDIELLSG
jgi:hypothetical protein